MDDWYIVSSIEDFVETARKLVFNSFGKSSKENEESIEEDLITISPKDQEEFNSVLTQDESLVIAKNMLKKQVNRKTKETRYMINDKLMMEIIESLNDRMVSNILNSLVNKGVLESAYDSESNDFVFWIKDNDETQEKNKNTETG